VTVDTPSSDVAQPVEQSSLHWVGAVALIIVALVVGWSGSSWLLSGDDSAVVGSGPMASVDQSEFAGETGIWIESVSLIGGGGLIEIRFRILDVDKSEIVHDTDNPPRIVAEDGFEIRFQRHEHGHDDENRLGGLYQEQLINLGGLVSRGDVITVIVGDVVLENVTVL